MVGAYSIMGTGSFIMLCVYSACFVDYSVLEAPYPFLQVFVTSTGSRKTIHVTPKNMANNMSPTTMMVGPAEGEDLSVTLRLSQHRPDRASGGRPQGVGPRPNGRVMDGA